MQAVRKKVVERRYYKYWYLFIRFARGLIHTSFATHIDFLHPLPVPIAFPTKYNLSYSERPRYGTVEYTLYSQILWNLLHACSI